jgi:hypothetical protein
MARLAVDAGEEEGEEERGRKKMDEILLENDGQ